MIGFIFAASILLFIIAELKPFWREKKRKEFFVSIGLMCFTIYFFIGAHWLGDVESLTMILTKYVAQLTNTQI